MYLQNMEHAKESVRTTVEPPNKGHIGSETFVLYSEVVPILEVPTEFYCTFIIDQYNVIFIKLCNLTLLATL